MWDLTAGEICAVPDIGHSDSIRDVAVALIGEQADCSESASS